LDRLVDQVNFQVQEAHARVAEAQRAVRLYETTILPAARSNVETAQRAYVTGSIPFISLLEAQRNLVGLRDRSYEVTADYFRWLATLDRVAGGPAGPWPPTDAPGSPSSSGRAPSCASDPTSR
jgi:cobalt-zinc-cadmium efflux system outer membrane protein